MVKILLELKEKNFYEFYYGNAIASPCLSIDDLTHLLDKGVLGCSVIWVPETKFQINKPLDISWWRGRAVAITDIFLV